MLIVSSFEYESIGETASAVIHRGSVEVQNVGEADFKGAERLNFRVDDGVPEIISIVTELARGHSRKFSFNFELAPGMRDIELEFADSKISDTASLPGADLALEVEGHRIKSGGIVEFDLRVWNHGELVAHDINIEARWNENPEDVANLPINVSGGRGLSSGKTSTATFAVPVPAGAYDFDLFVESSTIEGDFSNNSATIALNVEYVDLHLTVTSMESIGWDGDGRALMAIAFEVENRGVDGSEPFSVGINCLESVVGCHASLKLDSLNPEAKTSSEVHVWLPIGQMEARIFAAVDEDSFRWGESNVVGQTIIVPDAPDLVWDLRRISEPEVAGYWSDGSANVEFDATFINNGADDVQTVFIECSQGQAVVEDCGATFDIQKVPGVHPTDVEQTLRLPSGITNLVYRYGENNSKTFEVIVPHRIVGVDRDVWDCFSDSSFLEHHENDEDHDEGIGCAGWTDENVVKWPVGETIAVWVIGQPTEVRIFNQVLDELAPMLNLDFKHVANKSDAQLIAYAGWPKSDAASTGLNCIDFGGCARRWYDDFAITEARIAIWLDQYYDEERRLNWIRSASLHELLHALVNVKHRHHDHMSVMSYDALDYTTIDGMDVGLYGILAHPLVQPGMTFDNVLELIVFSDELIDPPIPTPLSAQQLVRRAHAAMMDAGSVQFEMQGGWPTCSGYDFGPSTHKSGNLQFGRHHWVHFEDDRDHFYVIEDPDDPYDPDDGELIEYWQNIGHEWVPVTSDSIYNNTNFRDYWSTPIGMFSYINIYADDSDYDIVLRADDTAVLEIKLDGPNPRWSRYVDVDIRIEFNTETLVVSEYEMTWTFSPKRRENCDEYTVRGWNPVYGAEFIFPDTIRQASVLID